MASAKVTAGELIRKPVLLVIAAAAVKAMPRCNIAAAVGGKLKECFAYCRIGTAAWRINNQLGWLVSVVYKCSIVLACRLVT